jgi:transcriptional regulator with XRE-family HTH domain
MTLSVKSINSSRADYDFLAFGRALKARHRKDDRGIRAIADEIGVTATDISRAMGGQNVSIAKVIALCGWLGVPVDTYYVPPLRIEQKCFTGSTVKHRGAARP